ERHVGLGADALQRLGEARQLMLVDALDAKLKRRDRPPGQRRPEPVRKFAADILRTDQVELAGIGPHGRPKRAKVDIVLIHAPLISERESYVQSNCRASSPPSLSHPARQFRQPKL